MTTDRTSNSYRWTATCESAFTCHNSAKPPETSKIVGKRRKNAFVFRWVHNPGSQVEMAFKIEIMPNFQHEPLYSPFLTCFK